MKGGPALMIGIGPADGKGSEKSDKYSDDEEIPTSAGEMAFAAMCKAKDRGDYAAGFEAFKELLAAADDEMGEDLPPEAMADDMPIM